MPDLRSTGGWYDVRVMVDGQTFARALAGHLQDGRPSISDPAFGRCVAGSAAPVCTHASPGVVERVTDWPRDRPRIGP